MSRNGQSGRNSTLNDVDRKKMKHMWEKTTMTAREIAQYFPGMNRLKVIGHANRNKWKKMPTPEAPPLVSVRPAPPPHEPEARRPETPTEHCKCLILCDFCAGVNNAEPEDIRLRWLSTQRPEDMRPKPYELQDETPGNRASKNVRRLLSQ